MMLDGERRPWRDIVWVKPAFNNQTTCRVPVQRLDMHLALMAIFVQHDGQLHVSFTQFGQQGIEVDGFRDPEDIRHDGTCLGVGSAV